MTFTLEGERKNSKVKKKNLEPIWTEHFEFPVEEMEDTLECVCDDWDLLSGNDFMGKVDIPLRLFHDRKIDRRWWWLCTADGRDHRDLGKIEMAFRLYHNPAYVFPTPEKFLAKDLKSMPPNVFYVHLVRAKGLPVMDANMMSKGGSSDPKVALELSGERAKSAIKKQTLSPIWEESFFFPAEEPDEVLPRQGRHTHHGCERLIFGRLRSEELSSSHSGRLGRLGGGTASVEHHLSSFDTVLREGSCLPRAMSA